MGLRELSDRVIEKGILIIFWWIAMYQSPCEEYVNMILFET